MFTNRRQTHPEQQNTEDDENAYSEGTECDHNILIQRICDHQDTQWNTFHTQSTEEIICPIFDPGICAMELIQI